MIAITIVLALLIGVALIVHSLLEIAGEDY